jgi:hypothetical protein
MVEIKPMPRRYLEISPRFRPSPPPVFDGDPTPDDRLLARELFRALDPESQEWYRGSMSRLFAGL